MERNNQLNHMLAAAAAAFKVSVRKKTEEDSASSGK